MIKKILRNILILILLAAVAIWITEIISSDPASIIRHLKRNGRLGGQVSNLKVSFLSLVPIPVGQAKIENLGINEFRGERLLHFRGEAWTFNYFSRMYKAKATIDSYIYPESLLPVYFLQHAEMTTKATEDKEIKYNHIKHTMIYKGKRGVEERIIGENVQDPLSMLYYFQNQKFAVGKEFNLSLNTNQKNYILAAKILEQKLYQIDSQNYEVWEMTAQVKRSGKEAEPRNRSSFKILFLTAGGKNFPIRIKVMTSIGLIEARAQ